MYIIRSNFKFIKFHSTYFLNKFGHWLIMQMEDAKIPYIYITYISEKKQSNIFYLSLYNTQICFYQFQPIIRFYLQEISMWCIVW